MTATPPEAPRAKKVPEKLVIHGDERIDDYLWLNERGDPDVHAYLEAENAYTERRMSHTKDLQQTLFAEMKGRIKQDDTSAPVRIDDYFYYRRYRTGKEYPIYCRKRGSLEADEEILLDVNALAAGREFFNVRGFTVSPDHRMAAFAVDARGRRVFTLHFKELRSGNMLEDTIAGVTGNQEWANDNRTLFYTALDPDTLRWDKVYRRTLGEKASHLVYAEGDDTFSVDVSKSKSERYLFINAESTVSTEYRYLPTDEPRAGLKLFEGRVRDHEYHVEDGGDRFYIYTNWQAQNFRVMQTAPDRTARKDWNEVVPHREDVLIEGMEVFARYLVLEETREGLAAIRVIDRQTDKSHHVAFDEETFTAYTEDNYEYDSGSLRYGYESLTTPESVYDYEMASSEQRLVKRQEIPGGFDPARYRAERIFTRSRDGVRVPISLVYRKGMQRDGENPLLQYA
ncbi:MAG: S9 family peptidase, partial [Gammaproteobacteria bacterium]|nr:S9 family peptidase [Gammaproteobacteria bacterium]